MGGTPDQNYYSICGRENERLVFEQDMEGPAGTSDTLKVTASREVMVVAKRIVGGREDCVDVNNRSQDVSIYAEVFEPRGKYLATIKGGSRNVMLRGGVKGHGSVVDVDIGNISDQSDELTGPVRLDLEHLDGEEITVRVLGGSRPVFVNGDRQKYRVVFEVPGPFKSFFLKAYKFLKRVLNPLGVPL